MFRRSLNTCHRKARAMFYRLVHLPSASPIEVHSRALVGDPQLLVPSRMPTSGSKTNRRPDPCLCDPGARPFPAASESVMSFLDIEVSESYRTSEVLLDQRRSVTASIRS